MVKRKKIEVVLYDPSWPQKYEAEADRIKDALGDLLLSIHHVGSTSVPGLAAKPKIDIVAEVTCGKSVIEPLSSIGLNYAGEWNIPFKFGFSKREGTLVNLHVYEKGHPEVELNVLFRDYLREHDNAREEYARLKEDLLKEKDASEKDGQRFSRYNLGKNAFISKVLEKAGFSRLRFLKCTHHAEWAAAKKYRQGEFFDKVSMEDPYTWTFDHKDHEHFVLYKGMEIIGYAHVQLWPEHRSAVRIIAIDKDKRRKSYGKQLMKFIERWLKSQGYKSLHVESSSSAVEFYRALGYIEMPFEDPDGYEGGDEDVELGKYL